MDTTSPALERPGSPIPSEMERATKKVWNKDLNENSPRDLTMEDFDKGKKSFKEILLVNVGNKGGGTYAILKNEDLDIVEEDLRVLLEGRLIGYKALLNRIKVLWKSVESFQVIDIDNDYFLPWSRDFSTKEQYLSKILVWMRLLGLPYKYYNNKLWRIIAGMLG
ncbi:hypothetical protein Gogos_012800, partial [Gossypium gossypioides]|nr:hypothetical protein [Gossypium gossypioides]